MNKSLRTLTLTFSLGALLAAGGCSELRKLTYPADFVYLEKSTVQSTMQQLAYRMSEITNLMSSGSSSTETTEAILVQLSEMESIALGLQARRSASEETPLVTSHLLIDENLDDFLTDIIRAKFVVQEEPPNYFGAGQLTGSCAACHSERN